MRVISEVGIANDVVANEEVRHFRRPLHQEERLSSYHERFGTRFTANFFAIRI